MAEARAAFLDECDEVIEHDTMRLVDESNATRDNGDNNNATSSTSLTEPSQDPERAEPEVVHRFTKRNNDPVTAPRRLITLRDARRGRPRSKTNKHGADPPV